MRLIYCKFDGPGLCRYMQDYIKSYTTCMWLKPQLYKHYGTLQQLPILPHLWKSISMNFIELLPASTSFNSILVIVDYFSTQAIFILIDITCTSTDLAQLFIVHVFYKHGISSYVICNCRSKFIFYFFYLLEEALYMHIHSTFSNYPETDSETKQVNQTLE